MLSSFLFVCYLQNRRFFQVYWSVDFVVLSVCLSACQSPTGHNSKPIVMKLYQVVEVVSTEKLIDFEVKGHVEIKCLKLSFFTRLTLKFEQDLHIIAPLDWETNYF